MFAPQHAPQPAGYAAATTPFSPHEHALFVEGVEVFCNNNNGSAAGESAWRHIAAHVRTRTPEEIKAHAQYYLMSLQSRNPEITCGRRVPALRPKLRAAPFRASGPRSRARARARASGPASGARAPVRRARRPQARVDGGHVDAGLVDGGECGL